MLGWLSLPQGNLPPLCSPFSKLSSSGPGGGGGAEVSPAGGWGQGGQQTPGREV